ncbi:MAG: hypothetical protein J6X27_07450 [Bacteroidaceae bacterium]|nr:hypothetical protein [Bacteroidaceae bacterium]
MKKVFVIVFVFVFCAFVGAKAQKIANTFWESKFGVTSEEVYDNLLTAGLQPIVSDDAIYLQDNVLFSIPFHTIGFKFTAEDAFYNIFGFTKFTAKQEAFNFFDDAYAKVREQYPNIQTMSRTEGVIKLYAYADADSGDAFSIGLYKGNGAYFVRLNIFSDYLLKRTQ